MHKLWDIYLYPRAQIVQINQPVKKPMMNNILAKNNMELSDTIWLKKICLISQWNLLARLVSRLLQSFVVQKPQKKAGR